MSPKEKAEELYSTMYGHTPVRNTIAEIEEDKQCAKRCTLTAVDEIMLAITYADYGLDYLNQVSYWEEVKEEIEKLWLNFGLSIME